VLDRDVADALARQTPRGDEIRGVSWQVGRSRLGVEVSRSEEWVQLRVVSQGSISRHVRERLSCSAWFYQAAERES
jgi:hypothetical protein